MFGNCFKGICYKEPSHLRKSWKGRILAGSLKSKMYPGKVEKIHFRERKQYGRRSYIWQLICPDFCVAEA